MTSADSLIEGILYNAGNGHDTVYCSPSHYRKIRKRVSSEAGMFNREVDEVRVCGLDVQKLDGVKHPIVCQKGDVFPLAKEYKNNEL